MKNRHIQLEKIKGSRFGDKLKTVLSITIWANILKSKIFFTKSLNYHGAFTFSEKDLPINRYINKDGVDRSKTTIHNPLRVGSDFDGVSLDKIQKIRSAFNLGKWGGKDFDLIRFVARPRIHPHLLKQYENEDPELKGVYEKSLNEFKELYWFNKPLQKNKDRINISVHIRRGDCALREIYNGYDFKFYKKIINTINKTFSGKNFVINIFCENLNCDDIIPLGKLPNTKLCIGKVLPDDFIKIPKTGLVNQAFHALCCSDFLFANDSEFSIMSGYLSNGIKFYSSDLLPRSPPLMKDGVVVYDDKGQLITGEVGRGYELRFKRESDLNGVSDIVLFKDELDLEKKILQRIN